MEGVGVLKVLQYFCILYGRWKRNFRLPPYPALLPVFMAFKFKCFSIDDTRTAMKVGTDGVLLGAWAGLSAVPENGRILDIGCGSGIVALMCAQRTREQTVIDAIEIDEGAARDAAANFGNSEWHGRINLFCTDFAVFAPSCSVKYDAIVSNPPYFRNSLKPDDRARDMARHTSMLDYDTLVFWSGKILAPNGRISLISPWESYDDIARAATENRLFLQRRSDIRTAAGEDTPKRVLTEWGRTPADYVWDCIDLNSREYSEMVGDFYIGMP